MHSRPLLTCLLLITALCAHAQDLETAVTQSSTYLQVGAFRQAENAQALQARLQGAGLIDAIIVPFEAGGSPMYRVYIGPMDSGAATAPIVDQLRELGVEDPIVVQRSLIAVDAGVTDDARITESLTPSRDVQESVPAQSFELPQMTAAGDIGSTRLNQAPKVFVQRIRVRGVTAFDDAEIQTMVSPYTNRELDSADLQALRVELSQRYVERQFVNSGVVLPDQRVDEGLIVYDAIEGQLTRIDIEGNTHLKDKYVQRRIRRHLSGPLKIGDLQYALQYLQNDPNIVRLDAQLGPGAALGESVLRLALDEPPRFRAGLGADNHRASSTGAEQATAYLSFRNLTGYGDAVDLSLGVSDGAENYSAILAMPITHRNTQFQIYGSRSDSAIVEDRFEVLDIDSLTDTWGVGISHPFIDKLTTTLSLGVGYESKHSETTLLGIPFSFSPGAQNGESDTNVVQYTFDLSMRGSENVFALRGNYRNGLDTGDATVFDPAIMSTLSNPTGADGQFDLFQTQILYLHRLNGISLFSNVHERGQLLFRTTGQFSKDPLMSLEKLAIGGVNTVRGYPENLLVRDNGIAVTIELQLPIPAYVATPHVRNLLIVPFVDYGRSWDKIDTDPNPMRNTDDAKYIIGAGLGLVWEPLQGLRAQVFWGSDVDDNFGPGEDPRDFRDKDLQDDGFHVAINYSLVW